MDHDRIHDLIHRAQDDEGLRFQLFHCPEKVIGMTEGITEQEAQALRRGDLSRLPLDDDTLRMGRKLFTEIPLSGDMPPEHAAVEVFSLRGENNPCL